MRTLYEELAARLQRDFIPPELASAAALAHEASWNAASPLGLFVITTVLRHMEQHWGDRGAMTQDAVQDMEQRLRPPMLAYLQADEPRSPEGEVALLNDLIRALFRWTAEGRPSDL